MGTVIGLLQIAGTIYIFYNAYKGTPKTFFMKIFCIIYGFMFAYSAIYYGIIGEWNKTFFPIGSLIIVIAIPFISKYIEKEGKH